MRCRKSAAVRVLSERPGLHRVCGLEILDLERIQIGVGALLDLGRHGCLGRSCRFLGKQSGRGHRDGENQGEHECLECHCRNLEIG